MGYNKSSRMIGCFFCFLVVFFLLFLVTAATHASRDIHVGGVEQAVRSYAIAVQKRDLGWY